MADYDAILLDNDFFIGSLETGVISGTITKASVGVRRLLLLYKNSETMVLQQTWSNIIDGSYSFSVFGIGTNDKFTIICKGEGTENDEIYTGVQAIFN